MGYICNNIVPKVIILGNILQSFNDTNVLQNLLLGQMKNFLFRFLPRIHSCFVSSQIRRQRPRYTQDNKCSCILYVHCMYSVQVLCVFICITPGSVMVFRPLNVQFLLLLPICILGFNPQAPILCFSCFDAWSIILYSSISY